MRVEGVGIILKPKPFSILVSLGGNAAHWAATSLASGSSPHCIRYFKKSVEIKLRSQMGVNVQQLFGNLHYLKD
ncbi:MAG: hypothetical protein V7K77_08510 [Nostoc sp.]|uniref:hypothetical protein n=1 Tax=Nostoc sp. TaxID=1180 RepID=UPI002FF8AE03